MSRRDEHVREAAASVELEAAVNRRDPFDPRRAHAPLPAAALAAPLDMCEELLDGRVIAVACRLDERPQRAPATNAGEGKSGERRRPAVAVALRAHLPLPNRGGLLPPHGGRVAVGAEHHDLARLETGAPQDLVRREPGEPGPDDRDAHYFTEPASSPCTKYRWKAKNTQSGTTSEMNEAGAMISMLVPNSRNWPAIQTVIGVVF